MFNSRVAAAKFGFSIFAGSQDDPSFTIAEINGGNIDVKTNGGSSPTGSGGTTKPGGRK